MRVLVVYAHHEQKSFVAAMKDAAVHTLTAQNHDVVVSDLYAMKWKAVADADDFGARHDPDYLVYALEQRYNHEVCALAPDIVQELDKIKQADFILMIFPLYWCSTPAIMKGWIDRVLVSGYCYGGKRFYDRGGLVGKKAMLAFAAGGRAHMFEKGGVHGDINDMLRPIQQGTLAYTGLSVLPPFIAYHVPYLKDEQRRTILKDFERCLETLEQKQPMAFPSLNDYSFN
ncbi:NAD(P)H dehydrogenase (quinone) [Azospirillaceae bacterium]